MLPRAGGNKRRTPVRGLLAKLFAALPLNYEKRVSFLPSQNVWSSVQFSSNYFRDAFCRLFCCLYIAIYFTILMYKMYNSFIKLIYVQFSYDVFTKMGKLLRAKSFEFFKSISVSVL